MVHTRRCRCRLCGDGDHVLGRREPDGPGRTRRTVQPNRRGRRRIGRTVPPEPPVAANHRVPHVSGQFVADFVGVGRPRPRIGAHHRPVRPRCRRWCRRWCDDLFGLRSRLCRRSGGLRYEPNRGPGNACGAAEPRLGGDESFIGTAVWTGDVGEPGERNQPIDHQRVTSVAAPDVDRQSPYRYLVDVQPIGSDLLAGLVFLPGLLDPPGTLVPYAFGACVQQLPAVGRCLLAPTLQGRERIPIVGLDAVELRVARLADVVTEFGSPPLGALLDNPIRTSNRRTQVLRQRRVIFRHRRQAGKLRADLGAELALRWHVHPAFGAFLVVVVA